MKVKSFTADTVAEALRLIKADMGKNAIVLKTRKAVSPKGTAQVEIIACINDEQSTTASVDQAVATETVKVAPKAAPVKKAIVPKVPDLVPTTKAADRPIINQNLDNRLERLERILTRYLVNPVQNEEADELMSLRERLRESDFSNEFIESLIHDSLLETAAEADSDLAQSIRSGLVCRLAAVMQPSIELKEGDRVLFIGPSGSGKSSMMGKLAAHLIGQKKSKVKLASIDDFKIGGTEELNSYADLLGLQSFSSFEVAGTLKADSSGIILIDSPGLTADKRDRDKLFNRINELNPTHCVFVFSALTRPSDLYTMAKWGRAATPTHFAMTMMDLSTKYGGVIKLAEILNCKMLWTSDAPGGIGDIQMPDPNAMARTTLEVEAELCKV
ncbi:MAG: hypothetical protein IH931_01610 [candidate division Zixibacteria bacterium]|nr:hypothetical protein [candidate division Zixibacteria bacterium]